MSYDDTAKFELQSSKSEQAFRDERVATGSGETEGPVRTIVRIRSFRTRLCDPDNICPKYLIDALRYAGAINDDREKDICLQVTQHKVAHLKEERTEVEIKYA
jgi:Holliday junction resolvase RusA-like endonuclease